MTTMWLPAAKVDDLRSTRGNGPFGSNGSFLGVVLHVNVDEHGTSDSFFAAGGQTNPDSVTPNFEIYKSEAEGGIHQYLPFNWQPWCQADGNFRYAAIETAGETWEPLTPYQLAAIASILAVYHSEFGMPLQLANAAGQAGFGTHAMGGAAWGGHPCPGDIRTAQRQAILDLASGKDDDMADLTDAQLEAIGAACAKAVWSTPHVAGDGKTYTLESFVVAADANSSKAAASSAEAQKALTAAGTGVIAQLAAVKAAVAAQQAVHPTSVTVTGGTLTLGSEK